MTLCNSCIYKFLKKKINLLTLKQIEKLFISSLRLIKKEVDKHKYIHGQLIVYFDFQFKAED